MRPLILMQSPRLPATLYKLLLIIVLYGCSSTHDVVYDPRLDSLIDTVYAGENREVFLSDLTGGYFYDDALGNSRYGEYGYSSNGMHLLSEWRIFDQNGARIDSTAEFARIHPSWIERNYKSGLKRRVLSDYHQANLLLTIFPPKGMRKLFLQPFFDFRSVTDRNNTNSLHSLNYKVSWNRSSLRITLSHDSHADRTSEAVISSASKHSLILNEFFGVRTYPNGALEGRLDSSRLYSPGYLEFTSRQPIHLLFRFNPDTVVDLTPHLDLDDGSALRGFADRYKIRSEHSVEALKSLSFVTVNENYERSFDLARLKLYEAIIHEGIPFNPEQNDLYTLLSLQGLAASDRSPFRVLDLLGLIELGGYFTKKQSDTEGFEFPLLSSLALLQYQKLTSMNDTSDIELTRKIQSALVSDLQNICESSSEVNDLVSNGLKSSGRGGLRSGFFMTGQSNTHFLHDNAAALPRMGALIEDQILLASIRNYMKLNHPVEEEEWKVPRKVIDGVPSWYRRGRSDYAPRVMDGEKTYMIPLTAVSALGNYQQRIGRFWFDRLEFESEDHLHPVGSSTQTCAHIIALGWWSPDNREKSKKLLFNARESGLIGNAGLRTLARIDPDYNSAHVYHEDRHPRGTTSKGDVLLWTAGRLADMYALTGKIDSLWSLVDRFNIRVTDVGIVGGLHEAENGDPLPMSDNITANRLHAPALAEYIRVIHDHVLGIPWAQSEVLKLNPNIPPSWGDVEVDFAYRSGRISYRRITDTHFEISQNGIKPYITIYLTVLPETERLEKVNPKRIGWSKRLHEGNIYSIIYKQTDKGGWITEAEEI